MINIEWFLCIYQLMDIYNTEPGHYPGTACAEGQSTQQHDTVERVPEEWTVS